MTIQTIQLFKDWLTLQGLSENTIRAYLCRILQLLSSVSIDNISEDTINAFLLKIKTTKSGATLNGYLHAIKSFVQFLKKDIKLPTNFKIDRKLPSYFSEDYFLKEIIPIIESIEDKDISKTKAIFYLLFYSGIRISEIDKIHRKDFNLEKNVVKIYVPKTKEERLAMFTDETRDILQIYFDSEEEQTNAFNISSKGIQTKIYRLKEEFSDINLHCHLFRHSFAMYCLEIGLNLPEVSKLLGHHSIQSTIRYTEPTISTVQTNFLNKSRKRQNEK